MDGIVRHDLQSRVAAKGQTYLPPFGICGIAYLVMANICRILLRNVLSTLSRSISAKSEHMICLEALLTRTWILPNLRRYCKHIMIVDLVGVAHFSTCLSTARLHVALSIKLPGTRRHWCPSFSTSRLVSLASSSSSGK